MTELVISDGRHGVRFNREKVLQYIRDNNLAKNPADLDDPVRQDVLIQDFLEAVLNVPDDGGKVVDKVTPPPKGSKATEFLVKAGTRYALGHVALGVIDKIMGDIIPKRNPFSKTYK